MKMVLKSAWWCKQQPDLADTRQGKILDRMLRDYETALVKFSAAESKEQISETANTARAALAKVETEAKKMLAEVRTALAARPDKKRRATLEQARRMLDTGLPEAVAEARQDLDPKVEATPDLLTPQAYREHLAAVVPDLARKPLNFAVLMPAGPPRPERLRILFHPTRSGRTLLRQLRAQLGAGKATFGEAAAGSIIDQLEGGAGLPAGERSTLVLRLEGGMLPNMTGLLKLMFGKMEVSQVRRVQLFAADMGEIETDDDVPSDSRNMIEESFEAFAAKVLPLADAARQRYPEQAAAINKLLQRVAGARQEGNFALALGLLRDQLVPLLKSSQRHAGLDGGDAQDLRVVPPREAGQPGEAPVRRRRLLRGLGQLMSRLQAVWRRRQDPFAEPQIEIPVDPGLLPVLREWSTNMAVLQNMAALVPEGSPEHAALTERQLSYLLKFASIPNAGAMGLQTTPLQAAQVSPIYHRNGGSPLTREATKVTAERLGTPATNTFLVSDRRVMEAVRRTRVVEGETVPVSEWTDADYDRVLRRALEGRRVFIDATPVFRDSGEAPGRIAQNLMVRLRERALANVLSQAGVTEKQLETLGTRVPGDPDSQSKTDAQLEEELRLKEVIAKRRDLVLKKLLKVSVGGTMAVGSQHALVAFDFSSQAGVEEDPWLGAEGIDSLLDHHGFTAGPHQLLECWIAQEPDIGKILKGLRVGTMPPAEVPDYDAMPAVDDYIEDFRNSEEVSAFARLADDEAEVPEPPYVKVNARALMALVEGLEESPGRESFGRSVREVLEERGLGALWQTAHKRIRLLMGEATAAKGSMRTFLDKAALIQEEVATLIAVAKPYSKEDFQRGMCANTGYLPEGFPGPDITADFTLKNSASRCFDAALTACEDMKEKVQGDQQHLAKRGLEVMVQADSYYEPTSYVLEHSMEHRQTALVPEGVRRKDHKGEERFMTLEEQIDDLKILQSGETPSRAPIDTFLCEFHHNIALDKKKYEPEKVMDQVALLISKGVVANPFTVTIDTTIARTDEEAVKAFLIRFREEISTGRMNVVIYRSAQKFDQLGGDMYNGGVMCVISAKQEGGPTPFQRALDEAGEPAPEESFQGLAHINLSAQDEVNDYRQAIADAVRRMTTPNADDRVALPAEMVMAPGNEGAAMLQVAQNTDEMAPFLDIQYPSLPLGLKPFLNGKLWSLFKSASARDTEGEIMASTRASFGFQHTNATVIGGGKMRLTPGLEDDALLARHTQTLVCVNTLMTDLQTDIAGRDDLVPGTAETLLRRSSLMEISTVEAQRTFDNLPREADPTERDAARLALVKALAADPDYSANPVRALRLIGEFSAGFLLENRDEIDQCRQNAEACLSRFRRKTPAETLLEEAGKARAANDLAGLIEILARDRAGVALSGEQRTALTGHETWRDAQTAALDAEAEARLVAAQQARDRGDAAAARAALAVPMPEPNKTLRARELTELDAWLDSVRAAIREKATLLLKNAMKSLEAGLGRYTEKYVSALETLQASNPSDLAPQITAETLRALRTRYETEIGKSELQPGPRQGMR
ncbi:hypothetical protein [Oceanicella sp. SM1341]|uniref:hypothetical protein n=1 Tax=Oceanicella sp. SM1341 TaxID=1548889 RepID=UPI000E47679E|nr:hypothetical protein [Oceanicella sp. SM1341]